MTNSLAGLVATVVRIGAKLFGGGASRVLYLDASGNIKTSDDLYYDGTFLVLNAAGAGGSVYLNAEGQVCATGYVSGGTPYLQFNNMRVGSANLQYGFAPPAGGAQNRSVLIGNTALFGIYYGSGAPTVVAAKGSLYLRTDGSGTSDRMYVATDGAGTWTAVTTAA
jgi:hypothetical protein